MPKPLTPTSSQEIVAISPPTYLKPQRDDPIKPIPIKAVSLPLRKPIEPSQSKTISHMSNYASSSRPTPIPGSGSSTTTLPTPHTFQPNSELRGKIVEHVKADKYLQQIGHVPTPGDPSKFLQRDKRGVSDKGKEKRKEREEEVERERKRLLSGTDGEGNRERTTQRMVRLPLSSLIDIY